MNVTTDAPLLERHSKRNGITQYCRWHHGIMENVRCYFGV